MLHPWVTGLGGAVNANGGGELGFVLVVDQPHLGDPLQIVCGVDLHTHTDGGLIMRAEQGECAAE